MLVRKDSLILSRCVEFAHVEEFILYILIDLNLNMDSLQFTVMCLIPPKALS